MKYSYYDTESSTEFKGCTILPSLSEMEEQLLDQWDVTIPNGGIVNYGGYIYQKYGRSWVVPLEYELPKLRFIQVFPHLRSCPSLHYEQVVQNALKEVHFIQELNLNPIAENNSFDNGKNPNEIQEINPLTPNEILEIKPITQKPKIIIKKSTAPIVGAEVVYNVKDSFSTGSSGNVFRAENIIGEEEFNSYPLDNKRRNKSLNLEQKNKLKEFDPNQMELNEFNADFFDYSECVAHAVRKLDPNQLENDESNIFFNIDFQEEEKTYLNVNRRIRSNKTKLDITSQDITLPLESLRDTTSPTTCKKTSKLEDGTHVECNAHVMKEEINLSESQECESKLLSRNLLAGKNKDMDKYKLGETEDCKSKLLSRSLLSGTRI